jgi:predicted TPR repeat methyltransferase
MQTQLDFTGDLTPAHIGEMEKYNKFPKSKLEQHYDEIALNYEGIYKRTGYPDPSKCQSMVSKYLGQHDSKDEIKIIDFACGSGLVGQALAEDGFTHITGVDISQKMLNLAESKEVYSNLEKLELCQDDHIGTIPNHLRDKFDFLTAGGLINNNHLDEKIFEQMLLCTKQHGYIVFTARFSYMGDYWYVKKLAELEKAGRLRFVESQSYTKYDQLDLGVGRFSKTPVKVFVYQKTEADTVLRSLKGHSSHTVSTVDSELSHRE